MASIDELLKSITATTASIERLQATLAAATDSADALATRFQRLGTEDKLAQTESVQHMLEAIQTQITAATSKLHEAQFRAENLQGISNSVRSATVAKAHDHTASGAVAPEPSSTSGSQPPSDDPMRALGAGKATHPDEWQSHLSEAESYGIEIRHRPGAIFYTPGLRRGRPGQLVIDDDASISA